MLKRCGLFIFLSLCFTPCLLAQDYPSQELERIVVSKNKTYLGGRQIIKGIDLQKLPVDSLVESLGFSGIDLQSRSPKGGEQADFSLRGSTFQGVLVLLDGQRVNDPQTAHHNADLPLTREDIARIELLPGVGSAVFGPDAIGGAVNFLLKKPQTNRLILEVGGGQHNSEFSLFSLTRKFDKLGLRVSVENRESGDFHFDTAAKKLDATFNALLEIPDGNFNLQWGYQEKEFGAFDFYTPGSGYPSQEWTKTYLLNTGLSLEKAGFLVKPNFLWRRHYDKFLLDKTLLRSRYLNHHRTDMLTPNLYLQRDVAALGRLGLGLEYGQERINSTNLGKHTRAHSSVFMDEGKDLRENLALGLSFRADDFTGFNGVYSGSANLKYQPWEKHSFDLGVARSIRVPSFTELYYSDPVTLGDAGLCAEKSLNYQLGYHYQDERLSGGLTFFARQEKDFIDWVKRTPTQAKWQAQNISQAEVVGFENTWALRLNQYLKTGLNYTYTNKRNRTKAYLYKYGPNYSRHLLSSLFTLSLPWGDQVLGLTYKKKDARGGWFLLDLGLSYQLNKHSRLFFKASNLLDKRYQEIAGVPQPGRWVEGGLGLEW